MRLTFNILAICGSAMYAGVMLGIAIILGGYWKSLSTEDFLTSFRDHLRFVGRAVPATLVPTLVGLAGSLGLGREQQDVETLWLSAVACIGALLLLTAAWFGPSNAQFASGSIRTDKVSAKLDTWLMLHTTRIALAAAASVLGIIAISR